MVSVIVSVNNSLVAEPIAEFGTAAQKRRGCGGWRAGEAIGAFALSEPYAGSDAANQQTTARRTIGGYVINGRKVWVANAEAAEVAIVFAATQPGHFAAQGVSAFLVPIETPGHDAHGARGFARCPRARLHGSRAARRARRRGRTCSAPSATDSSIAMWALDGGRVAIAAQALGIGEAALDAAIAHAKQREAFGQPIANYQAIQWMLADRATELDAARMLTMKAADARERRSERRRSRRRWRSSPRRRRRTAPPIDAMQILASHGYRRGSLVERLFRDVRATEIYQGTSEVQRMVIADQLGIASGRG